MKQVLLIVLVVVLTVGAMAAGAGIYKWTRKDEKPLSILPSFQGIVLNYALSFTGVTVISHIPITGNIKSRNLSISSVSTNMK